MRATCKCQLSRYLWQGLQNGTCAALCTSLSNARIVPALAWMTSSTYGKNCTSLTYSWYACFWKEVSLCFVGLFPEFFYLCTRKQDHYQTVCQHKHNMPHLAALKEPNSRHTHLHIGKQRGSDNKRVYPKLVRNCLGDLPEASAGKRGSPAAVWHSWTALGAWCWLDRQPVRPAACRGPGGGKTFRSGLAQYRTVPGGVLPTSLLPKVKQHITEALFWPLSVSISCSGNWTCPMPASAW